METQMKSSTLKYAIQPGLQTALIALCSTLLTTVCLANDLSEFERGFNAGRASCEPIQTEYWLCTAECSQYQNQSHRQARYGNGATRATALKDLLKAYPECLYQIAENYFSCREL